MSGAIKMACLTIGFTDYLLPYAKALKVAELLQDIVECEVGFDDLNTTYTERDREVPVEFALVRPQQVRKLASTPKKPRS